MKFDRRRNECIYMHIALARHDGSSSLRRISNSYQSPLSHELACKSCALLPYPATFTCCRRHLYYTDIHVRNAIFIYLLNDRLLHSLLISALMSSRTPIRDMSYVDINISSSLMILYIQVSSITIKIKNPDCSNRE